MKFRVRVPLRGLSYAIFPRRFSSFSKFEPFSNPKRISTVREPDTRNVSARFDSPVGSQIQKMFDLPEEIALGPSRVRTIIDDDAARQQYPHQERGDRYSCNARKIRFSSYRYTRV